MDFLDALSMCWWLGKECVPKWEAWAAIASIAAVVTTGILGVVTYRLGKAANRASRLAVALAGRQAKEGEFRGHTERLLVLLQVAAEVIANTGFLQELVRQLSEDTSEAYFVVNADYRREVVMDLAQITFPISAGLMDRLHYLDRGTSSRLVRAIALLRTISDSFSKVRVDPSPAELRQAHVQLHRNLPLAIADLEVVRQACEAAVRELGIADAAVVRAAMADMPPP